MKRKQPIQPAPQALKRDLCPCGVDARTQHQCRWRPVVKSPQDVHRQHDGPQNAVARNSSPNGSAQQRRIMIIGSLPSARRKNKAAKLGINGTSALHPRLKGMPVDVFHPEPFNAYPIPTIGVVHRMTEHCETSTHVLYRTLLTTVQIYMFGRLSKASHLALTATQIRIYHFCGHTHYRMQQYSKVSSRCVGLRGYLRMVRILCTTELLHTTTTTQSTRCRSGWITRRRRLTT